MKPRHVLHVLGTAAPAGASIASMVRMLALGLDKGEFRLSACFLGETGPWSAALRRAGVVVLEAPWSGPRDVRGARRFWRAVRPRPVDLVHLHYGGRSVRAVARFASNAPLLVHVHGRVRSENDLRIDTIRLPDADAVVATSRAVAAVVDASRVRVVYPGVTRAAATARRDPCTIGAAGRLVQIKGYRHLIASLVEVRRHCPDARLEIAGEGPSRADLEREARALGLEAVVRFLGWSDDLPSLMGRWTVFAQPSLEEALGITVLQAMACGLPVVASAVGGIAEIVQDGATGRLVASGDVTSLAGALTELLEDAELRSSFGAAAFEQAGQFSEERFVQEVARVYRELLGPTPPRVDVPMSVHPRRSARPG